MGRNKKLRYLQPKQWQYVEMLCDPETMELTEDEIGARIGVNRSTLYRWKQDPFLWEQVYKLSYQRLEQKTPDVYRALGKKAGQGNIKAIELYLKFLGRYVEKFENKVEANVDYTSMSDKELEKALKEAERLNKLGK